VVSVAGAATHVFAPSQTNPAAHCDDPAHCAKQLPVDGSQRYGAHGFDAPSRAIELAPSDEQLEVFGSHRLSLHTYPSTHSPSFVQALRQALPSASHAKPPQGVVIGAGHDPVPVQFAGAVAIPPVQLASRHGASELVNAAHDVRFAPSHVARSHTETSAPGQAGRPPRGAPFTATHFPRLPTTSHASHCPVHALSQQIPSTQFPDPHSPPAAQAVPFCFMHLPFGVSAQLLPAPQSVFSQHTPSVQNRPLGHDAEVVHESPTPARGTHLRDVTSQNSMLEQSLSALHAAHLPVG
jgi:hypothetical protein